jgi:hypothetical protein
VAKKSFESNPGSTRKVGQRTLGKLKGVKDDL